MTVILRRRAPLRADGVVPPGVDLALVEGDFAVALGRDADVTRAVEVLVGLANDGMPAGAEVGLT